MSPEIEVAETTCWELACLQDLFFWKQKRHADKLFWCNFISSPIDVSINRKISGVMSLNWTMRPLDNVSLGRCVYFTMRYLDDAFLRRCVP
jgi:hypothetical protein